MEVVRIKPKSWSVTLKDNEKDVERAVLPLTEIDR